MIKAQAFCYEASLKRPFSTSRHTTSASKNYIVRLEKDGVSGIGEAAPRGRLTGDDDRLNGKVAQAFVEALDGRDMDFGDRETALRSIAMAYSDLESVAAGFAGTGTRPRRFRGLLSGVDIALLDLAAKTLGIRVSELLGEVRTSVRATASTVSTSVAGTGLQQRFVKQALRYNAYRCKGAADLDENFRRLDAMRTANALSRQRRTYWLDLNEALGREAAFGFLDRAIEWMREQPHEEQEFILEQPVKKSSYKTLCRLQRHADERLPREAGRIVVMADESLWDASDFERLHAAGGCGAMNIKVPKAGGLLPALELASRIHETDPEVQIYIGGMIGTSDISGRAIYNLAKALPRLDHCTTVPSRNLNLNVAREGLSLSGALSREISLGEQPGIGTDIDYSALEQCCVQAYPPSALSGRERRNEAIGVNTYDFPELLRFGQKELDSHLMEREALLNGLTTTRRSGLRFAMQDEAGLSVSFSWTMMTGLSKQARRICSRKYETKERFRQAGVPIAEGRSFSVDDMDAAAAYARELGWPVVVKPGVGTAGVGVTANIRTEEELRRALDKIVDSPLVKKRNDGHVIVERHVEGVELRVFVACGEVVGAVRRLRAHVVGDGSSTIKALVAEKNARRSSNPRFANSLLKLNDNAAFELRRQALSPNSIPESGRVVHLCPVASISQGADTQNVVEEVHPSIAEAAVRAVDAVPGLLTAGLDFIMADYTGSLDGQSACICEINTTPSIAASHFPMYGPERNVARDFVVCAARSRKLALGEAVHDSDRISTIESSLDVALDADVIRRISEYCLRHGLQGGATSTEPGATIHARGRQSAVCALPSAIAGILGEGAQDWHLRSRLVQTSANRWASRRRELAVRFKKTPRQMRSIWSRLRTRVLRLVRR